MVKLDVMVTEEFVTPTPPFGVVESLSKGFELAASHIILILIPILLDIFLWVGPRQSFDPVIHEVNVAFWSLIETAYIDTEIPAVIEQDAVSEMVTYVFGSNGARYLINVGAPGLQGGNLQSTLSLVASNLMIDVQHAPYYFQFNGLATLWYSKFVSWAISFSVTIWFYTTTHQHTFDFFCSVL